MNQYPHPPDWEEVEKFADWLTALANADCERVTENNLMDLKNIFATGIYCLSRGHIPRGATEELEAMERRLIK